MAQVVSFVDYVPPPRYDANAWTEVQIEEGTAGTSDLWTLIDTIALSPVDLDPADPASRSFTTENGTALEQWYRVIFADVNGDTAAPTIPVQNIAAREMYATVAELATLLKVNAVTREAALTRVLRAAADEIDAELDLIEPFGIVPPLVVEVSLERAREHWEQMALPFGIIGLPSEAPIRLARDSWERHAFKLAPLKETWGIA